MNVTLENHTFFYRMHRYIYVSLVAHCSISSTLMSVHEYPNAKMLIRSIAFQFVTTVIFIADEVSFNSDWIKLSKKKCRDKIGSCVKL